MAADGLQAGCAPVHTYLCMWFSNLGAFRVITTIEENAGRSPPPPFISSQNQSLAFFRNGFGDVLAGIPPPHAGFFSRFYLH